MPTYKFRNIKTGEVFEKFMSISDKEYFITQNPNIAQILTGFGMISIHGSLDSKTDDTFKEVLAKIGESHPASAVADRYCKKTISETKTKSILDKHRKKTK